MRISDWSSDVCSSDLRRDWANLPSRLREGVGGGPVTKRKPYTDKASNRPTARSRELRRNMIPAARRLWSRIRARQLVDTRFNTKFPIGPFICDFVSRCPQLMTAVDGRQPGEQGKTGAGRTASPK